MTSGPMTAVSMNPMIGTTTNRNQSMSCVGFHVTCPGLTIFSRSCRGRVRLSSSRQGLSCNYALQFDRARALCSIAIVIVRLQSGRWVWGGGIGGTVSSPGCFLYVALILQSLNDLRRPSAAIRRLIWKTDIGQRAELSKHRLALQV